MAECHTGCSLLGMQIGERFHAVQEDVVSGEEFWVTRARAKRGVQTSLSTRFH